MVKWISADTWLSSAAPLARRNLQTGNRGAKMSTATLHRRLRERMPYLTPTFAGEDDIIQRRRLLPYDSEDDPYREMQRMEGVATEPGLTYNTLENRARLERRGARQPSLEVGAEALRQMRRLEGLASEPGLTYNTLENRRPHLGGRPSGRANYREGGLVMPKLTDNGYEERVVGPEGNSVGFGDERDQIPLLRRPPMDDIDRIANLGEANPLPMPESDVPLLSRSLQMPQPRPQPPTVTYDQGGRPTSRVFGGTDDPEQRVLARRRALEQYQPQKESKKPLALRTILNFVGGGIPGAAQTLIGQGGVMDRRGKDRAWQREQLGQVDESLGRMRTDRRAGLQDQLLESQVAENKAQAAKALREPTAPPIKPTNIFAGAEDVEDADGNIIMVGPDGQPIINPATGQPYVRRRMRAPAVKPEKPDTSEFTNEQISRTIGEIEAEQKTLGPSPPTEIADTNQLGDVVGKKTNPAYLDWAKRYRELDDQKRQLQMKRKPLTRGSDPQIKSYADKFFKGDYVAAEAAIKKQRGQ